MLSYVPLLRIAVHHPYFRDGLARALDFLPDPDTAGFLKGFGVLLRKDDRSLVLQAETGRLEDLWREWKQAEIEPILEFLVVSKDPLHQVYTSLAPGVAAHAIAPPLFQLAGPGAREFSPGQVPGVADPGLAALGTGLAQVQARARIPVARLRLSVNPRGAATFVAWRQSLGGNYVLPLDARSTVWKYTLLDDWHECAPRIVDLEGQVAFADPEPVVLENGASALVIRSVQPIPLQEHSKRRFQLLDGAGPDRVLINRLPVAAPQRFNRESVNGKSVFVSEIFLNR